MVKIKFLTLKDMDLENKKVLVRVDYNVSIKNGMVEDDTRLKASIPTINKLLEKHCKIILMSHLGRPSELLKKGKSFGEVKKELTLMPVAEDLADILGMEVILAEDSIGLDSVSTHLPEGDIILLENIQFNRGETKNDDKFAKQLASLADIYVNDGFGQSHREYASFCAITKHLPSCAGLLVEKEAKELSKILNPQRPFVAIVAGAKSDKIGALRLLAKKADKILIGGVLANTFLKAKGCDIGASKFDEGTFAVADEIMNVAGEKIKLPSDSVIADSFDNDAKTKIARTGEIPDGWMALDIGPETVISYKNELKDAKTILWAGPLGVFEMEKFSAGTKEIGHFIGSLNAVKIVGGGDSAAAVNSFNLVEKMTHVSTGGGASLEFIEKEGKLPALIALDNCCNRPK